MTDHDPTALADATTAALADAADPDKATAMAAYMKTEMPFFGVQARDRDAILRDTYRGVCARTHDDLEALVLALWQRPHREEKYLAIRLARRYPKLHTPQALPLLERLIREGAWWDFVDEIATHLLGAVLAKDPEATWPVLDAWIKDPDLWIRRAALLAQNRRKGRTDVERLFAYCLKLAEEEEFFIRKAIGWALRQYAYTDAEAVRVFLEEHGDELSGLSVREASKHI